MSRVFPRVGDDRGQASNGSLLVSDDPRDIAIRRRLAEEGPAQPQPRAAFHRVDIRGGGTCAQYWIPRTSPEGIDRRPVVETLTAVLLILVAIAIVYEIARRIGVPYPTLLVLGGLGLAFVPGLPRIELEPDLVLLVFLPPLLFSAAAESPIRDLRANLAPLVRLSIGLVLFTMVLVAVAAHALVPGLSWPAAFTLGAIVGPTDALAATTVFRRLGAPRIIRTLIEGEALFNDATALVAYRTAVLAVSTSFILSESAAGFVVAAAGGVAIGAVVGRVSGEILRRLDDPPVEVLISVVIPFAAYLPADELGLSGVLAAVTAGLVIGSRLGTILSPSSRILWLTTWKMIGFVLNGFVFVLIGLELPEILESLGNRPPSELLGLAALVSGVVVGARIVWVFASSLLPGSPRRAIARRDPRLATRLTFVVSWAGLRGAVSLAAALALPATFPERNLILFLTFAVILVTLVGQGLTLPRVLRWADWDGVEPEGDEATLARNAAYQAGLEEVQRARDDWPGHQPLFDRLESGLRDRTQHLATEDPDETAERRQERVEHEEIQRGVIAAQRAAVIELRDRGQINDLTLRLIERELDLEELRMEG
jgi:Na+/H+ antiporter